MHSLNTFQLMKKVVVSILVLAVIFGIYQATKTLIPGYRYEIGDKVDSLNGVYVYYNKSISNVVGRNVKDGYNIGLKYQCVEFVKRYYYEHLNHKMPDSYGHAISFYDESVKDGSMNTTRNLIQYSNPGMSRPKVDDLLVMGHSKYGHVAIISAVTDSEIEIIQQNPGKNAPSRISIPLSKNADGMWYIEMERVLGWLRKQ